MIGPTARAVISFWHCFVNDPAGSAGIDLDRKLFVLRKRTELDLRRPVDCFPSLSSRTLVYKGMLTAPQAQ
jgi:glutamate synthase (NADPH/NADH) large chain